MKTNNSHRWTSDELDNITNEDFVRWLLRERIARVQGNSILHKKIVEVLLWLNEKK